MTFKPHVSVIALVERFYGQDVLACVSSSATETGSAIEHSLELAVMEGE